ncbi:MAG TPA: 50S ribosomal protein L32 [Clostridiales bacterium]|jgi:ribosomal protein L32|nr:50S ribosomal protein L32 [Clostridiales bacterium]
MAVPKKKVSKARRDKRRSNNSKLSMPGMTKCSNPACDAFVKNHCVCKVCGFYNGKKVLDIKADAKKA